MSQYYYFWSGWEYVSYPYPGHWKPISGVSEPGQEHPFELEKLGHEYKLSHFQKISEAEYKLYIKIN